LNTISGIGFIVGVGRTVIVNVCNCPTQPLKSGVTIIDVEFGKLEVFIAIKGGIFPCPVGGKPIEVLLFDQMKLVPCIFPTNEIFPVIELLQ
jgi:hypothetical protein